MFIALTSEMSVAPQISLADCTAAQAAGFAAIVCNRPDGESPGQASAAEIAGAARALGLRFAHIPVDATGIDEHQIAAMAAELAAGGRVLAYCRSGTRSTHLWALATAASGGEVDAIIAAAAAGGYDVAPLRPWLRDLAAGV